MAESPIDALHGNLSNLKPARAVGRVVSVDGSKIWLRGLEKAAAIGDRVQLKRRNGKTTFCEVLHIRSGQVAAMPEQGCDGIAVDDAVKLLGPATLAPSENWIGRVIDPNGNPMDGLPLLSGGTSCPLKAPPPNPAQRRSWGSALTTGLNIFDTMLPIVQGQRIGLFAGSGVGKSSLLADLTRKMQADVVVLALIGERGRELRDFVENSLGKEGMARCVVVVATSDRSPLERRRCPVAAMTIAEYFRDQGKHVLFLADSITRFAEAHREVAISAGEIPTLKGYPASTPHQIMALCERAGPGKIGSGDISAVFSVLVPGSDMEEPIADILRGVLDGHVILDRKIAEAGRFPAIDILRSVSRSLPGAVTEENIVTIGEVRRLFSAFDRAKPMIMAGLYRNGSDPETDVSLTANSELESFFSSTSDGSRDQAFSKLELILRRAKAQSKTRPMTQAS